MPMAQNNGSGRNICEANGTFWKNGKTTLNAVLRGDIGGLPIPQYRKKKLATDTEIPCRKSTKYRYRIYDRSRFLNVVSISSVFLSQACTHQKSTSAFARKREISGYRKAYQFHQRVTIRNCVFIYRCLPLSLKSSKYLGEAKYREGSSLLWIPLARRMKPAYRRAEWYRNTAHLN